MNIRAAEASVKRPPKAMKILPISDAWPQLESSVLAAAAGGSKQLRERIVGVNTVAEAFTLAQVEDIALGDQVALAAQKTAAALVAGRDIANLTSLQLLSVPALPMVTNAQPSTSITLTRC